MRLSYIPFLFLVIPMAEIAVFIVVGQQIGLWSTLAMVVLTAFLGTLLLRYQGFRLLGEIRAKIDKGELPGRALVHGAVLLVAGLLLVTPGFVTDFCGFLLFVPAIRDKIWQFIAAKIIIAPPAPLKPAGASHERRGRTIDLDATEFGPADHHSPWRDKQ